MKQAVQSIPTALIYEMVEGNPIYYKGYKAYLKGQKQLHEVMGSSSIQAFIVAELIFLLRTFLGNDYLLFTNEVGLQFSKKTWRAADIAIVKADLVKNVGNTYLDVAPEMVVEIDTKAELRDIKNPLGYYQEKTQELIRFGVEKVVWIFTDTQKILVATPNESWQIHDWKHPIEIQTGLVIEMKSLLQRFEG